MRTSSRNLDSALELLEAAAYGFEVIYATRRYRGIFRHRGLEGITRVMRENRERELHAWLRAARRSEIVKTRRIGNRLRVRLTDAGWSRLFKARIKAARRLPPH